MLRESFGKEEFEQETPEKQKWKQRVWHSFAINKHLKDDLVLTERVSISFIHK